MKQKILKFSRYIALFFFSFSLCFAIAAILFYHSNIPQNTLKSLVEFHLGQIFHQKVTIETLEGSLYKDIKITGIKVPNHHNFKKADIISIGTLTAKYNMLALLKNKGNFTKGFSDISVEDVYVEVLRNREDLWNIFFLLPPSSQPVKTQTPANLPSFSANLNVKNLNIFYTDERGWRKKIGRAHV